MDSAWILGAFGWFMTTTGGAAAYPKFRGFSQLVLTMKDFQRYVLIQCCTFESAPVAVMEG